MCLHGIGGDDASFLPQLEQLSDEFRVISWNMPGYSGSGALSDLSFLTLASALNNFIVSLDCGPVHLIGQSIGGMLAQELYHCYPQQVRSLVLVATTTAFGGKDESFKEAFMAARLAPLDAGRTMAQLAAAAIPEIVARDTSKAVIQSAVESMAHLDAAVYRSVLSCLVTFDRRQQWTQTTCPVCIVSGSEDTNAPAATMQRMAQKLRHASYHELAGAGHLVNLEKPDQFNAIVRSFVKRIID